MRFYGRKSGRNRPGARFARSYFYYSKRKGCRNNTTTQTRNNGGLSDGSSYGKVEASSEFIMFMGVLFIAIIILGIFAVVVSPQAEKGDMIALLR